MRHALLAFVLVVLVWGLAIPATADQRPNILFVFLDDHASHAIGAYDSKINTTPNIDRLAREGMLFRNCFCTNSICAPSRAVVLTGKHSHANGLIDNRVTFDGSQQTFPKLLQAGGYQTAIVGKWHLKSEPTGFDHWIVLPGQGLYYNPDFITPEGRIRREGYVTDIITDMALDYLENMRDADKPFMLMYQHKAPHREWAPGPDHLTLYQDIEIPEPDSLFDQHETRTSATAVQEMTIARHLTNRDLKFVPPNNLTPEQLAKWNAAYGPENEAFRANPPTGKDLVRWKYQRYIKDYLRTIASVDDNLGRVLKYLDDTGLADNTIVIYSSDQGFYLGDKGWYDKRWMYEESLRMPLIVKWPNTVKPGSDNSDLVQNLDFASTFLEIAGVEIPDDLQGHSIVPLLKGQTPEDWRESIYYEYFEFPAVHMVHRHYGVRTLRHKLIHYHLLDEWELFDLQDDPSEARNLYDDPQYATLVAELKAELERLRKGYGADTFPQPPVPGQFGKTELTLQQQFDFGQARGATGRARLRPEIPQEHLIESPHGVALRLPVGEQPLQLSGNAGDPSGKTLTVGGWVKPGSADGVIIAQGGQSQGWALWLKQGRPVFTLRSAGSAYNAQAGEPLKLGDWAHVVGIVDQQGRMRVLVNGQEASPTVAGRAIGNRPSDGLTIGGDADTTVGNYPSPSLLSGEVADLRYYLGVLPADEFKAWHKAR